MNSTTASPSVKPAQQWTEAERLDMAGLIVDPFTNGGDESEATAEQVAAALPPEAPAWGVWLNGSPVFLVGLWPFDRVRGCLHLAGTRTLTHPQHVALVRAFLSCMDGIDVFTVTRNPALARLARQVGLTQTGELDGTYTLGRASQ